MFNAGSVGNPTDEATASYAVLHGVLDSAETASFSLELVRVPYDIELAVKLARDADLPDLAATNLNCAQHAIAVKCMPIEPNQNSQQTSATVDFCVDPFSRSAIRRLQRLIAMTVFQPPFSLVRQPHHAQVCPCLHQRIDIVAIDGEQRLA